MVGSYVVFVNRLASMLLITWQGHFLQTDNIVGTLQAVEVPNYS